MKEKEIWKTICQVGRFLEERQGDWWLQHWRLSLHQTLTETLNSLSASFVTNNWGGHYAAGTMSGAGRAGQKWDRGTCALGVNSLSVSLYVRSFSSPGESSILWQKNDRDLMGITAASFSLSLFPTPTDRSQIHNNRPYFNTFSVGTQGWLKINNLSIASRALSFLEPLLLSVLCCCCCACCAALFGGDFLLFSPSFLYSLEKQGMLSWVQSVIRHRAALSVSLYKQLWCLFLFSLVSMGKWLLERALDRRDKRCVSQ